MVDIYRRASRVIVWLGQEAEGAGKRQDLIDPNVAPGLLPINHESGQFGSLHMREFLFLHDFGSDVSG